MSPADARTERNWTNQSLGYFRRLQQREDIPSVPTVRDLGHYAQRKGRLRQVKESDVLVIGDFIIWPAASRHGDCGIYLGHDRYLILDPRGRAIATMNPYKETAYVVDKPKEPSRARD